MTLPVVWNAQAREDLVEIIAYISARNPAAAERLADALETSTWALPEHPNLYKVSRRIPGCREIVVHNNYIVIYRVDLDCVRVLRVVHGSRMYF